MSWLTALAVFFIIWWVTLFAVLPLWVRPHTSKQEGLEQGAPEKPYIGRKFLLTTVIALVFFGVFYLIAQSGIVNFREMATELQQQQK